MTPTIVPHSVFDYQYPDIYFQADQKEKGTKLLLEMFDKAKDELNYYKTVYTYSLNQARTNGDNAYYAQLQQGAFMERHEVREELFIMQELNLTAKKYDLGEVATKINKEFDEYRAAFVDPSLRQQMRQGPGQPQ